MRIALEDMRRKRRLSQVQLARLSGIPQAMISNIESGNTRSPRVDTLAKLALALKCTVDDLIEDDENPARADPGTQTI